MSDISATAIATNTGDSHEPLHGHGHSNVAHQFDDAAQQKEASILGMWAFLATEIMFFGGVFLAYSIYRSIYPQGFAAASAKESWLIGGFNTAVLLCSSLTVVLAVWSAHRGDNKGIARWLIITNVLGLMFIGVKAVEYTRLYREGLVPGRTFDSHGELFNGSQIQPKNDAEEAKIRKGAQIFFSLYFCATAIHALHMIVGVGIMSWVIMKAKRGDFSRDYFNPVEISGLYWHFVDIVWIFLYPMLYLIQPNVKPW